MSKETMKRNNNNSGTLYWKVEWCEADGGKVTWKLRLTRVRLVMRLMRFCIRRFNRRLISEVNVSIMRVEI